LLGLVAGGHTGFSATLFYTTIYAVTLVGAFGVCAAVREETGGDDLANFTGLIARSPVLAACMVVFLLSLAGIPPLAGFFGKFYLFSTVYHAGGNHGLLWLVAIALFGSFISLYYYLIVLKAIVIDQDTKEYAGTRLGFAGRAVVLITAVVIVIAGVIPAAFVNRILAALA